MGVLELENDSQFIAKLQQAGSKPVFVDFFATWCGPCRVIAPVYERLSNEYPQAVFLKVDVDELEETAQSYGVTAMPTFMCFKNGNKLEEKRGGDPAMLEALVKKYADDAGGAPTPAAVADEAGDSIDQTLPKGQMNLQTHIDPKGTECLNESDDHKLAHAWTAGGGYLESDVDEQLIITIAFNQKMKLHSLRLVAEGPKAPKTLKLFINLPNAPDFDSAESMVGVQEFTLTEEDMKADSVINLKYVKFQSVQSVTMFIKDNQGGEETTQIDHLAFIGTPVSTTNMNEFKRVAGKAGESH